MSINLPPGTRTLSPVPLFDRAVDSMPVSLWRDLNPRPSLFWNQRFPTIRETRILRERRSTTELQRRIEMLVDLGQSFLFCLEFGLAIIAYPMLFSLLIFDHCRQWFVQIHRLDLLGADLTFHCFRYRLLSSCFSCRLS